MAIFKLNRVNATKWDLKQEQLQAFEALRVYVSVMGKTRPLTDVVLVNLIMDHGADVADKLIKAYIGRGFFALNKLQDLIDGTEPFEWKSPFTNERQPSYRNPTPEPRNVQSLLRDINKQAQAALVEYPTADHVYDEKSAGAWMRTKFYNVNDYLDYFEVVQTNPFLFQLKSEYR